MKKLITFCSVVVFVFSLQSQNIENQLGSGGKFLIKSAAGDPIFTFEGDQLGQPELIIANNPFSIGFDAYQLQVQSTTLLGTFVAFTNAGDNKTSSVLDFNKSRNTGGSPLNLTAAKNGDDVGILTFQAHNGSKFTEVSAIKSLVDGEGTNDPGGKLLFTTKPADGETAIRMTIKSNGSINFTPLAQDPAGTAEAGDVYYNSTQNKLKVYDGTAWVDLH